MILSVKKHSGSGLDIDKAFPYLNMRFFFPFFFLVLYLFNRNTVMSNSGRLQLFSANVTYDIQIPSDVMKSGRCNV